MSARITPLRLEAFEQLPKHARRCVFWEVDPSTLHGDDHLADPEFEKEAWLSMVMLEWGSCGQLAVACEPDQADFTASTSSGDEACLGFAFYAPPRAVPRAGLFPTGPVSADAVLLTTVGVESGDDGDGLTRALMAAVVGDLVRRGVRALEAFGRTAEAAELVDPQRIPPDLRPAVQVLGDCSVDQLRHRRRLPRGRRVRDRRTASVLPSHAPRARAGAGLEGRRRGGTGAAVGKRATPAARGRRRQPV